MNRRYDLALNYPYVEGQDGEVSEVLANVDAQALVRDADIRSALIGELADHPNVAFRMTSGGQAALATAVLAVCPPGSLVAAEAHTFPQFRWLADRLRLQVIPVEMDESGLIPDSLEHACQVGATALYCMPTFHNPLGRVVPYDRRISISAIARSHGVTIIEDDAYSFLDAFPPPSLQAFLPDATLRVFSINKLVSRNLQLGALSYPAAMEGCIEDCARHADTRAAPVLLAAAAKLAGRGRFAALAGAKRAEGQRRQTLAQAILGPAVRVLHINAWHVILNLDSHEPGSAFAGRAARLGVIISPMRDYRLDDADVPAARISLGGEPDPQRFEAGLWALQSLLEPEP